MGNGFTFRDINIPPSSCAPGGIIDAGFFDERWQFGPTAEQVRGR
jgi:hypothetical protein